MLSIRFRQRIKPFVNWARKRTVNNHIISTPAAVMHAVSQIERGDEILD